MEICLFIGIGALRFWVCLIVFGVCSGRLGKF